MKRSEKDQHEKELLRPHRGVGPNMAREKLPPSLPITSFNVQRQYSIFLTSQSKRFIFDKA
jgi:hypothetical protein